MFRLTARSCSTCHAALRRSSVAECSSIVPSPSVIEVSVPLKSNRWESSRPVWSTALRTSCRSTSLTMSKENWSLAMSRSLPSAAAGWPPGSLSSEAHHGRMPERPKGAVCKIAGDAYGGSNPPPPTDRPTDTDRGVFAELSRQCSRSPPATPRLPAAGHLGPFTGVTDPWDRGLRQAFRGLRHDDTDLKTRPVSSGKLEGPMEGSSCRLADGGSGRRGCRRVGDRVPA